MDNSSITDEDIIAFIRGEASHDTLFRIEAAMRTDRSVKDLVEHWRTILELVQSQKSASRRLRHHALNSAIERQQQERRSRSESPPHG